MKNILTLNNLNAPLYLSFHRAKSYIVLLLICLVHSHLYSNNIDSLETLLPFRHDTAKINILNTIGKKLLSTDNQQSLEYINKAIELSKKISYKEGLTDAYYALGLYYYFRAGYANSLDYIKKSLALQIELNRKGKMADAYSLAGTIYDYMDYKSEALDNYLKALKIYENISDEEGMANCYNNISLIYDKQKRYDLALDFLRKSLIIDIKNKSYGQAALSYINIADIYMELRQYKKALSYYDSIVPVLEKDKNYYALSNAFNLFAEIYFKTNEIPNAINYYKKSVEYADKAGNLNEKCISTYNLAQVYLKQGNIKMAEKLGEEALSMAGKLNRLYFYTLIYNHMATVCKTKGDYEKAFRYFEKYSVLYNSLKNEECSTKLLNTQTFYETRLKDQKINILNKENAIKTIKLTRQRMIIFTIIISLFITLLITIILYGRYRNKQKINQLLEFKNKEIEKQREAIIKINQKLSEQTEELKNLDETKSRFFTNISHEFRTPLTLIISPLERLKESTSDESLNTQYNLMLRQSKRLLNLVNQLLELSKLQKGVQKLQVRQSNLNQFIRTIVSAYDSLAKELNIDLQITDNTDNMLLWFDHDKVEKIITNLLTNALKFTESGGKIRVTLTKADKEFVEVVIKDTGKGISSEHLERIFDPFCQADSFHNNRFEGTGIGLALVKELVHVHHGHIKVDSAPGKGSEFTVSLPASKSKYTSEEIYNDAYEFLSEKVNMSFVTELGKIDFPSDVNITKEKRIILLTEDNNDMRNYIKMCLADNYQIIEAHDGEEGIRMAYDSIPDIVIADIMMPRMNGIEMTKILKNDRRTCHIPVIILTAKALEESKLESLQSMADEYLTKPFNVKELIIRIENILANRDKLREKFGRTLSVNPSEITSTSLDEQFLAKALTLV